MPTWWYLWDEIKEATENLLARYGFYFGWRNQFVDEDHAHTLPKCSDHVIDLDGECYCKPEVEPIVREDGSYAWLFRHRDMRYFLWGDIKKLRHPHPRHTPRHRLSLYTQRERINNLSLSN